MKTKIAFLLCVCACSEVWAQPVSGRWDFNNPSNLNEATVGTDLSLVGTHQSVAGIYGSDNATRIGIGSYYRCFHGISPNGGGSQVNRYALLIDFKVPTLGPWYCFFQTDESNSGDGDCFVRSSSGQIGVGSSGYSPSSIVPNVWNRLVVTVDNAAGLYDIYINGERILLGSSSGVDGRFALGSSILLFADDNGEDAELDVSMVALFSRPLTAQEIADLGSPEPKDPTNHAPEMIVQPAGPDTVQAGASVAYQFQATDVDNDTVKFLMNWGDGSTEDWSSPAPVAQPYTVNHMYKCPGVYPITARVKDEHGDMSAVTPIQSVTALGVCAVDYLTPPYLQNMKPDSMTIMWELEFSVLCQVEYGLDNTYGNTVNASVSASGGMTYIYRATIDGLLPYTAYHCRVVAGGAPGEDVTFKTAPIEPIDFAFSVWSDTQGTNGGINTQDPYEPTKAMFRHMRDDPEIHFGTNSGDLAENGNSYNDTRNYYLDRTAVILGQTKPWFCAWGNHDQGRSSIIRKFADFPCQERSDLIGGQPTSTGWGSYSFDYAGCHFIMIDADTFSYDVPLWLENDLKSAANQNARFTFLFLHYPPYCEVWIDGNSYARSSLVPLMQQYGVDICFSGHTHGYYRGQEEGVFYCVTGGGSWLDIPEPLTVDWPQMTVGGFHPLAIDVSPLGLGGEYGIINEYVKVKVSGDSFHASGLGFTPAGEFYGIIDEFGVGENPVEPTPTLTSTPSPTSSPSVTATRTPTNLPPVTPTPTQGEVNSMVEDWELQR